MLVILVIGPGEASAPSPERDPTPPGRNGGIAGRYGGCLSIEVRTPPVLACSRDDGGRRHSSRTGRPSLGPLGSLLLPTVTGTPGEATDRTGSETVESRGPRGSRDARTTGEPSGTRVEARQLHPRRGERCDGCREPGRASGRANHPGNGHRRAEARSTESQRDIRLERPPAEEQKAIRTAPRRRQRERHHHQ